MSSIKSVKFILPVLFLLFIFTNSYVQLNQQSYGNSTTELSKVIEEVQNFIDLDEYDLALEKLQSSRENFKSAGNICAALAVDTWTAKIYAFTTNYQQAISLLKNTKYDLEQLNCSSEFLAFKDMEKVIIALDNNLEGVTFYTQNKTSDAIVYLLKARDTYHEIGEDGLAVLLTGEIGTYYLYAKSYEKAISYFQEALRVGESMDNALVKMLALGSIGCCYGLIGDHEKAKNFFEMSLDLTSKIKMTSYSKAFIDILSSIVNYVANENVDRSRYLTALRYYEYALNFNRLTGNLKIRGAIHGLMGFIYSDLYQFNKSIEHHQQSLQIARDTKDFITEENDLSSIALDYKNIGEYDKAIEYYMQALKINKRTKDMVSKKGILEGLGLCNLDLGRNDEAIDYFMNLLDLCEKSDDTSCRLSTLANLSICYEAIGNLDEAIKLEHRIIEISKAIKDQKMIALASLELSSLYRKLNDESSAISSLFAAFISYYEMEDRQTIIDNIYLGTDKDYFRQKKYKDIDNYLKKELSSAEEKGELKKQIFITILLADLNYYYHIDFHKNLDLAFNYYKAANQLNKKLQDPQFQKDILFSMAYWYFYIKNDSEKSLNCMKELFQLAIEKKDVELQLDVIENIVEGYKAIGRMSEAIKYNQQGLKIAQEVGLEKRKTYFYSCLGAINYIQGNYQKAIEFRSKALALSREYGDVGNVFFQLNSIAWAYFQINQFDQVLKYAEEAFHGYIIKKNHEGVIDCLTLLVWANSEMGNNQLAQQFLSMADKVIPYVNDFNDLKAFYLVAGIVKMRLGDYQNALKILVTILYYEQLAERKNLGLIAEAYGAMGLTYIAMGDYKKAQHYVEKSLDFFRKASNRWGEATALNNLSLILGQSKNYKQAFDNLTKAERIFREIGNIKGQIEYLVFKNLVLGKQLIERKKGGESIGDTKIILDDLQRALELSKNIEDKNSEAAILIMLGIYYFEHEEFDKARKLLQDALLIAEKNFLPSLLVATNHELGKVFEAKKRYSEALICYQKAIEGTETLQSTFSLGLMKGKFFEIRREPYDYQFKLLVNLYQQNANNKYKELAFTTCEKAKARSLLDSLNRVQASEPNREEQVFSPTEDIEKKLGEKKNKLRSEKQPSAPKTTLKKDLAILQDELTLFKTIQQQQEQMKPPARNLATPDIQYQQIQSFMDEDTIFIEYVCSEDKLYSWLITKDRFEIYEFSITLRKFEELVKNYRAILMKPQLSTGELVNHIKLGQELFKILLSPMENEILEGKKLIIVPDGPLYYLPFETLIIPPRKPEAGQKNTQVIPYLITKTPISYFHSGAVMASMMKKSGPSTKTEKGQYDIVAFGDPIYSSTEKSKETEVDKRGFYETRGINFERLTYSSQEVKNIAKIFNLAPTSECINLREKANEKRVHDLDLTNYRRIHFATHGILADEITWINQPALVLSLLGADEKYDGFFSMEEIYDMDLNADLVVLSACKTGLGEEIRGEGLVGLTHAFIHAGTNSVVVSLWDVNDRSTSMLMERFYQYLKTMNKSEALRQAKLDLMKGESIASKERGIGGITEGDAEVSQTYSHPFFWAPFILIGKYD
jgi:CHAT domain-containing protein/Tfp pilus assembly protein PilF